MTSSPDVTVVTCALLLVVVVGSVTVKVSVKVHDTVDILCEVLGPEAELTVVCVTKVEEVLEEGRMVSAEPVVKPEGPGTDEGVGNEGTLEVRDVTHENKVGDAVVSQVVTSVSLAAGMQRS